MQCSVTMSNLISELDVLQLTNLKTNPVDLKTAGAEKLFPWPFLGN